MTGLNEKIVKIMPRAQEKKNWCLKVKNGKLSNPSQRLNLKAIALVTYSLWVEGA